MKIKISVFNKSLLLFSFSIITVISAVMTILSFFGIELPSAYKKCLFVVLIILIVLQHIVHWIVVNRKNSICIKIRGNTVHIRFVKDIFEEKGIKVIPVNEFFDTEVGQPLIGERSLHGQFISKKMSDVSVLDAAIENDSLLNEHKLDVVERPRGKKQRYELGSVLRYQVTNNEDDTYLLAVFSKTGGDYKARMTLSEYTLSLIRIWRAVYSIYGGADIAMPLLGSGTLDVSDYSEMPEQEKLELLLTTLKISNCNFKNHLYLDIYDTKELRDAINLYKLKEMF